MTRSKVINENSYRAEGQSRGSRPSTHGRPRSGGKLVAVAFYADEAALEGSAEAVEPLRSEAAAAMSGTVLGSETYELVAQSW